VIGPSGGRCRAASSCLRAVFPLLWLVACQPAVPAPRLLLLVTVDTLRADRLAAFGSTLGLTPHLDALAAESTVFTAAYASAPFTLPSVAALMTGKPPEAIGIHRNESLLSANVQTLAAALRDRGWHTRAVVSNFVLRSSTGIDNGFDAFDDEFSQREAVRGWPERDALRTTDAALASLDRCLEQAPPACFLWVHYQDPHGPYTPPGDLRAEELVRERDTPDGRRVLPLRDDQLGIGGIPRYQAIDEHRDVGFYRAGYHAEIRYVDREIGRLLDGVARRGVGRRAVVAFTADHGEGLGEDDYWFAHGEYLSDALVRVPLMIRKPGVRHELRRDVAALTDLPATLWNALGEAPLASPFPGRALLAPGAETGASRPYLATLGAATHARYGLVEGDYKLVLTQRDGVWEPRLTRRGRDDVDVLAEAPQIARPMGRRLKRIHDRAAEGPAEVVQPLSDDVREQLRGLGYVEAGPGR